MFTAQLALHVTVFAVVNAANNVRKQTLAASHGHSAEGVGNPDAPPVGDLSCIASLRLNRSSCQFSCTAPFHPAAEVYIVPDNTSEQSFFSTPRDAGAVGPLACHCLLCATYLVDF